MADISNPLSQIAVGTPVGAVAPNLGVTAGSALGAGGLTQGTALPNITTTQQQATATPQFYLDYLNQLAQQGATAAQSANYAGASPLQQQAFGQVGQNVGNYNPALTQASNLAGSVGASNITGALGNLNQQNIANNLSPQATAGIVGSGQFGSSRGASALGQVINQADIATQAQQAQAMQQDYANRLAASNQFSNIANQTQNLGLGDVNALSTLGAQQQTIAQNQQLFPMQQLTAESNLLKGSTIPTATSSSYTGPIPGAYNTSPLAQIAGVGSVLAGTGLGQTLFGSAATGNQPANAGYFGSTLSGVKNYVSGLFNGSGGSLPANVPAGSTLDPSGSGNYITPSGQTVLPDGTPIDTSGSVSSSNTPSTPYIDPNTGFISQIPDVTGSAYDPNSYGAG